MEPARNAKRVSEAAALLGFVVLCLAVAAAGGLATATSVGTWYAGLAKPAFNPPAGRWCSSAPG
jgi:benzodiazapine receptor